MAKKINVDQIEGNATIEKNGLMSSQDKEKLDTLEPSERITADDIDNILNL